MKEIIEYEQLIGIISKNTVRESIFPYFKTSDFCLYNNDSIEVMERLPDNCVDMIFADPPYLLSNNGITCHSGKMVSVIRGSGIKVMDLKRIYYSMRHGYLNAGEY